MAIGDREARVLSLWWSVIVIGGVTWCSPPRLLAIGSDFEANPLGAHGDERVPIRQPLAPTDVGAVERVAPPKRRAVPRVT